jgi:selenocysteine lyase/cysteine desulfurase
VYAVRKALCDFFGGYSPERVVFTKNCTEALNIAILGSIESGDRVVTTVAEHNSVLRPLYALKNKGVHIDYAPLTENGDIDVDVIASLVNEQTKAVVITLASNVTGCTPDMLRLKGKLPEKTLLICDGAQACGHVKIDMKELGIDALAVAGHKGMCGIQGSGALIFSERFQPHPIMFGGTGSMSFDMNMPDFYPDRLESGTLNYPAIISLGAGVLWLNGELKNNEEKATALTSNIIDGLGNIEGVKLFSRPNPYGIVAFNLDGMTSEEVAFKLSDEFDICVRGGLHCAPLMHKALGTNGLIRASLGWFNTQSEVEMFIKAIKEITLRNGAG